MDEEEMILQIKDLISDRKSFITDDEETSKIFKKDVAALEMILDKYNMLKENKLTPDELVNLLNQELVRQNKDYKEKFDKIIKCLGIDEEILETCGIYDVDGIEVYKILQGVDK